MMALVSKRFLFSLSILVTGIWLLTACRDEIRFSADPALKLRFSADTVLFDTVFTSIGTATKVLMVYNSENKWVKISSIRLARGQASPFRMNIDGQATLDARDIELAPRDSLFIFVRATINPKNQSGILIESDSIVFSFNNKQQDVKLAAWAQDAYFYSNIVLSGDYVMNDDKPHVIYGYIAIDSLYTMTVNAGARLHFHRNSFMLVYRDASLRIMGTKEKPVIIQGDRPEYAFRETPGQWGHKDAGVGIYFYPGSKNNRIQHAIIRNGIVGLQVDSTASWEVPALEIFNSEIRNMSGIGLLARGSHVRAANTVIANCGSNALALVYGGKYDFRHMTIANYWNFSVRLSPAVILNNYYTSKGKLVLRDLSNAYFGNCVIYGSNNEELAFDSRTEAAFNYLFENCHVKVKNNIGGDTKFINSSANTDPRFFDAAVHDLRPDTLSPLINKGALKIIQQSDLNLTFDLRGKSRILDNAPDIGAYEYQPKPKN